MNNIKNSFLNSIHENHHSKQRDIVIFYFFVSWAILFQTGIFLSASEKAIFFFRQKFLRFWWKKSKNTFATPCSKKKKLVCSKVKTNINNSHFFKKWFCAGYTNFRKKDKKKSKVAIALTDRFSPSKTILFFLYFLHFFCLSLVIKCVFFNFFQFHFSCLVLSIKQYFPESIETVTSAG